jgi:hypothetical protein
MWHRRCQELKALLCATGASVALALMLVVISCGGDSSSEDADAETTSDAATQADACLSYPFQAYCFCDPVVDQPCCKDTSRYLGCLGDLPVPRWVLFEGCGCGGPQSCGFEIPKWCPSPSEWSERQ